MSGTCESCRQNRYLEVVVVQGQPFAVCGACAPAPPQTPAIAGQGRHRSREQG